MQLTAGLSTLLVVLPLLVPQAVAAPGSLEARAGFGFGGFNPGRQNRGGFGGFGGFGGGFGGRGGNRGGNNGGNNAGNNGGNAGAAGNNAGAAAGNNTGAAAGNNTAAGGAANNDTGVNNAGGNNNNNDPQTSLTLDPSVIGANLAQDGQGGTPDPGQVPSLTSVNNFINFCIGKTITNGQQVEAGSCNPVPMGDIPPKTKQPSCKFVSPKNLDNVAADTPFTVQMAIQNLETGNFVNAKTNYFSAPQQLNAQQTIIGHSHIVIEPVASITDTKPTDPTAFAFFLGLNAAAQGGVLTANVDKGLPAGTYRLASINTNANHGPAVGPVAQHGSFDDMVYFTVGDAAKAAADAAVGAAGGAAGGNQNGGQGGKKGGRRGGRNGGRNNRRSFSISRAN